MVHPCIIDLEHIQRFLLAIKKMEHGVLELQSNEGDIHCLSYDSKEDLWNIRCLTRSGIEIKETRRRITHYVSSLDPIHMALIYVKTP